MQSIQETHYCFGLDLLSSENEDKLAPEPGLLPEDIPAGWSRCLATRLWEEVWNAHQRGKAQELKKKKIRNMTADSKITALNKT